MLTSKTLFYLPHSELNLVFIPVHHALHGVYNSTDCGMRPPFGCRSSSSSFLLEWSRGRFVSPLHRGTLPPETVRQRKLQGVQYLRILQTSHNHRVRKQNRVQGIRLGRGSIFSLNFPPLFPGGGDLRVLVSASTKGK